MTEIMMSMLAIVTSTLAGRSLLALFDRVCGTRAMPRHPAEVWGISILLGASFTAAAAFVWSDVGRMLSSGYSWGQVIVSGMLGALTLVKTRQWSRCHPETLPQSSPTAIARTCQVVLSVVIGAVCVVTCLAPQHPEAEHTNISIKARILYETGTIDAPGLVHPAPIPSHSRDPLLLPLLARHLYALQGRMSDSSSGIWALSIFLGLVLGVAGVMTRRTSPAHGWLLATGLALVLTLISGGSGFLSESAGISTACFHGAAVLCLWDAMQEAPGGGRLRGVLLSSGMASSACFVQNEGLAFLVVDCLAWGVTALLASARLSLEVQNAGRLRSLMRHFLGIAVFALFAAILLTPWMRYRATLPATAEWHDFYALNMTHMRDRLSTIPLSLPHLIQRMSTDWLTWILPGAVLLVAVFTVPRRNWNGLQIFLVLNLLGSWAALACAAALVPAARGMPSDTPSYFALLSLLPAAMLFVDGAWRPHCLSAVVTELADADGTSPPRNAPR